MVFEEISPKHEDDADIRVSFQKQDHRDVDPFPFRDDTLGHAFQPGEGILGDAHFRDNIDWDFDVIFDQPPAAGKTSFFAVLLHEIGHSIGMAHSR